VKNFWLLSCLLAGDFKEHLPDGSGQFGENLELSFYIKEVVIF
jgi:hypothetical protein